ncbi:hypothetical protein SAMN05443572_1011226 [Myxococcus fulvus]|uniref:DUF560 domain-containing protein n=1 Tax=Myxococcus fulvus TaxID=33 RepID=A0A511STI7_MYXFU|nr:hypothetical protein [Myxococcus fulvus]AKF79900.1 hypothetical protein MFUL124B02_07045 [Myxococcus fulvus 124B02]GEN05229.1 hypothetical protein MFU01_02660 [Myxococcus fulvus]SET14224.1 hypothetical protein SAMN05443572_1011226 [Myxococcus fulvus]
MVPRVVSRVRPTLLVFLVLATARPASAAEWEGALKGTLRLLADTNAPRDFTDGGTPSPGVDPALSVLGSAEGKGTFERTQLVGRYELGARKYAGFSDEDTLIQAGALEASLALGTEFGLGAEGHVKDRRGGTRAYSDLGASAFAEYAPDVRLALRVRAGARRFVYRPDPTANFGGLELGVLGRYRFDRRHSLSVFGDWGARRYGPLARPRPGVESSPGRREDGALTAGVGYNYKGPLTLGLRYTYQEVSSNSYGETVLRHRVSANAGVRLPWRMTLLAQGSLGVTRYPDGIYLSPEIILVEEDEGQNSLSLKLSRPVSERVDLELSWGLWSTRLPRNDLRYSRQVFGVGVTWRD